MHLLLFVDFFVLHMNHSLDSPIFIAAIVHNGKRTKVKSLHIVRMRSELYELPAHAVTRSVGRTRDNEALRLWCGTAGRHCFLRDSPAECGTVGKYGNRPYLERVAFTYALFFAILQ
jgi:hypothetical protein